MTEETLVTRRDFLRGAAGVAAGATLGGTLVGGVQAGEGARVVLVRHREALTENGEVRGEVMGAMLDEAIQSLLRTKEPMTAWRSLFQPSDVVGIKSNSWRLLPTPKEVENTIQRRLMDLGIPERNLSIDDRGVRHNEVFSRATALLNVRPVRTHFWAGIGGCLKNYIMFVPTPSEYHGDACSDLGAIWHQPAVKGKTRLNVLCAFTPQFYGRGPNFFDRRYVWPYGGIIVGTDPVAVDAVGAHLLAAKRVAFFGEDRPLDVSPKHIEAADRKHGLGTSDLRRIDLVKLGWTEDMLI
jgi:hypothetical protein